MARRRRGVSIKAVAVLGYVSHVAKDWRFGWFIRLDWVSGWVATGCDTSLTDGWLDGRTNWRFHLAFIIQRKDVVLSYPHLQCMF